MDKNVIECDSLNGFKINLTNFCMVEGLYNFV